MPAEFLAPISRHIWEQKYRLTHNGEPAEASLDETLWRVAKAAASVERGGKAAKEKWAGRFFAAMAGLEFIPGGRILAGAGSRRDVTLFNCFVLGRIDDDLGAIFDAVKEAALTMQAGGGIGHDFSTLRPRGAAVHGVGAQASGPVSFMEVWDGMCRTIMSAGQRRGAMMATLQCDHPDIEEFITAKSDPHRLRNFNLSVLVSDAFMAAVKAGGSWNLVFDGRVYKTVDARTLWSLITQANYRAAEPGVIFIDRVNALNNLAYCEEIHATNPCGEQPLPPYGACLLGSINLARLVTAPFTASAALDTVRLRETVASAVRLLDNIIDVSAFPLPCQKAEAKAKRRVGLGITGLADALILLGIRYGSKASLACAGKWMSLIQDTAYLTSAGLAAEKGPFPMYDAGAFLGRPNVAVLSPTVRREIERHGLRNGCLTSIAPAGTISLLAGNVSSGIEPVFGFTFERRLRSPSGPDRVEQVEDYAHALYRLQFGGTRPKGEAWVRAAELSPREHLAMQAALQPHVDSAISKTINCPADIDQGAFAAIYLDAYDQGLKGCTTFRPNATTGAILSPLPPEEAEANAPPARRRVAALASAGSGEVALADPPLPVIAGRGPFACPHCLSTDFRYDGACRVCLVCGHAACE